MDKKDFTQAEYNEIINQSIKVHVNLLPYVNTDNFQCLLEISDNISTVVKYDITPEKYLSGNSDDYNYLIFLLADGLPSEHYLLLIASQKIPGAVSELATRLYQKVNAMFSLRYRYAGYVALTPTPYMQMVYPTLEGKLFCYTEDILYHGGQSEIGKPAFIIDDSDDSSVLFTEMKKGVEKLIRGG